MTLVFLGVDTEVKWIDSIASVPILGHFFSLLLIYVPPVLISFLAQAIIPGLHNDMGFSKAMLLLLPGWNLLLWLLKVKQYFFFMPSWFLLGVISIVKIFLMISGLDNGQ